MVSAVTPRPGCRLPRRDGGRPKVRGRRRSAAGSRRGRSACAATLARADQRAWADDPAVGPSAPARRGHGSLGDGDLLPGVAHRDFPVLVRRAERQRLSKLSSKVGQVRIAAATATADSVTQGDHLTVGQQDCLGLRIRWARARAVAAREGPHRPDAPAGRRRRLAASSTAANLMLGSALPANCRDPGRRPLPRHQMEGEPVTMGSLVVGVPLGAFGLFAIVNYLTEGAWHAHLTLAALATAITWLIVAQSITECGGARTARPRLRRRRSITRPAEPRPGRGQHISVAGCAGAVLDAPDTLWPRPRQSRAPRHRDGTRPFWGRFCAASPLRGRFRVFRPVLQAQLDLCVVRRRFPSRWWWRWRIARRRVRMWRSMPA